jgi:hypothetical protein
VQALVRALVAGQDFADLQFSQYLMQRQEALVTESTQLDGGDLAAYNRVMDILRGHLETELEETLAQFRINGSAQSRVAKLSATFWVGLPSTSSFINDTIQPTGNLLSSEHPVQGIKYPHIWELVFRQK